MVKKGQETEIWEPAETFFRKSREITSAELIFGEFKTFEIETVQG